MEISFKTTQKGNLQLLADIFKDKGKTKFLIGKEENYTPLLAEEMKKVISDGNVLIPLKKSTRDIRRERGIAGNKPLFATGALHDSIKPTNTGVEMKEYGIWHAVGFNVKTNKPFRHGTMEGKDVPRRRFHLAVMNEKTAKRISNEVGKNLSKNIKKAIGAGMVTKTGS